MVNGQDRGGDKPRQSHDGTNANQDSYDQEIQMVASTFLQKVKQNKIRKFISEKAILVHKSKTHQKLVFFTVDNDCGNLLIHEYQNGGQESRKNGHN